VRYLIHYITRAYASLLTPHLHFCTLAGTGRQVGTWLPSPPSGSGSVSSPRARSGLLTQLHENFVGLTLGTALLLRLHDGLLRVVILAVEREHVKV
jgi:hypothetical protein